MTKFFGEKAYTDVKVDTLFGKYSVPFVSFQDAVEGILELMGTRASTTPVIIPVTASVEVVSAALRAGAQPVIMDVAPDTLQYDPKELKDLLDVFEEVIVLVDLPFGCPVDPGVKEVLENQPWLLTSQLGLPPTGDSTANFDIYSIVPITGSGAVLTTKHLKQLPDIYTVRDGTLGHSGKPGAGQASSWAGWNTLRVQHHVDCLRVKHTYEEMFKAAGLVKYLTKFPTDFAVPIHVNSAQQVGSLLALHGIETILAIQPLSFVPEIRARYQEPPSYPVAEALADKLLLLPCHGGVTQETIETIIEELKRIR